MRLGSFPCKYSPTNLLIKLFCIFGLLQPGLAYTQEGHLGYQGLKQSQNIGPYTLVFICTFSFFKWLQSFEISG